MKNLAELNSWFVLRYPSDPGFNAHGKPTEEFLEYFALPTDSPVCLFGVISNDTRSNSKSTEFTDGHRIITGDIISFTVERAETERTIYMLRSIHPKYAEWLSKQGYTIE